VLNDVGAESQDLPRRRSDHEVDMSVLETRFRVVDARWWDMEGGG
jgi:hypothetical protein